MKGKFLLTIALLFAMTPASAALQQKDLKTLAIVFLALCVVVLIIAIIIPLVLIRRTVAYKERKYASKRNSKYNLSGKEHRISQSNGNDPIGFYGIYTDPQPASGIYLPLEKRTETDNGTYAHLEGSKPEEDPHTYEELNKSSTFGPTYENPGTKDDEDDNDYEIADATIVRPRSRDYENPTPFKTDTDTAF